MGVFNVTELVNKQLEEAASKLAELRRSREQLRAAFEKAGQDELYWLGRADSLRALLPTEPAPSLEPDRASAAPPAPRRTKRDPQLSDSIK